MSTTGVVTIYTSISDVAAAEALAHGLIGERMVACANIMPGMTSIYRFEGKVETASEVAVLFKTTHGNVDQVIARIKALHPAKLPCIVVWPIENGHAPYLRWVKDNAH